MASSPGLVVLSRFDHDDNVQPTTTMLHFTKGHALGNDYLVIDAATVSVPIEPSWIRALCDRHKGAGADGVLLGELGTSPVGLRIFNPDGTEAEKSGNGLRIFAAYLHHRGIAADEPFDVRLPMDTVTLRVEDALEDGGVRVVADMGRASFAAREIGFERDTPAGGEIGAGEVGEAGPAREADEVGEVELSLGDGETARVQPVSLSNPHCVVFVDALDRADFLHRAPRIGSHAAFTAGTNVQFAHVAGADVIDAWVWERGAGETLASGSSACAIVAAARRHGRVDSPTLRVHMPGGALDVEEREDGMLRLRGPARVIYEGTVPAVVLETWRTRPPSEH